MANFVRVEYSVQVVGDRDSRGDNCEAELTVRVECIGRTHLRSGGAVCTGKEEVVMDMSCERKGGKMVKMLCRL